MALPSVGWRQTVRTPVRGQNVVIFVFLIAYRRVSTWDIDHRELTLPFTSHRGVGAGLPPTNDAIPSPAW
ncbi:hypothetical protein N7526_007066 [Penicillium atrosanguineum]|nr:hypothetical protein N7526_007066 [Penicillium atrosanguineum]